MANTTNYGWVKPDVGASDDVWGGQINTDLDGIDTTVKSVSTVANAAYPAANPSGYQTAAQVTASLGAYLPLAGGTLTGNLTITESAGAGFFINGGAGESKITINAQSGQAKSIYGTTVGTTRWLMQLGTSTTESGSNAGSDFQIINCSDAGSALGTPVSINRATGIVTIPNLSAPQAIGDNRIINGDMRIDQRNAGAVGTASGYTIDRWRYDGSVVSKGQWQRITNTPTLTATGFPYFLQFASTSAYAVLTGDYFVFSQIIEADAVSDFNWGSASAQPVTLSFWAFSSLTGTFGGSIRGAANARSYPFSYSIPVASTWTRIVVTIPGDTTGAWVLSGNASALNVNFSLGTGATFSGAAGSWSANNYLGTTGAVSVVGTNAAVFNLTGVKLEIGSVATPFNRQSLAKSMADCQRYFKVWSANSGSTPPNCGLLGLGYVHSTTLFVVSAPIQTMRALPTLSVSRTNGLSVIIPGGTAIAATAYSTNANASPDFAAFNITVASGLTVGQGGAVAFAATTDWASANAEL